jgi:hypothetical protein
MFTPGQPGTMVLYGDVRNARAARNRLCDELTREALAHDEGYGTRGSHRVDQTADVGSTCHARAVGRHALARQLFGDRAGVVERQNRWLESALAEIRYQ